MKKQIRLCIYWLLGLVACGACAPESKERICPEMKIFEEFSRANGDSLMIVPRKIRAEAFQRMGQANDSLVKYNYLTMVLKTYLVTTQFDSVQILLRQIDDFIERQEPSPEVADLGSECFNMEGNLLARMGNMDSAEICFQKAYELRMEAVLRWCRIS